jgi:hypothetical protein
MVISAPGECLDGLVELLEDLSPEFEGPGLVLTSPSFPFPLSFASPSLLLALPRPSLCEKATSNTCCQGACDANAGNDQGNPQGRAAHVPMMEANTAAPVEVGHIGAHQREICLEALRTAEI